MSTFVAINYTNRQAILYSGNFNSGFQQNGGHGTAVDQIDNTTSSSNVLGQFFFDQQWLMTAQTMNWWPPQFLAIIDTSAPAGDDLWAMSCM